MDRRAFEELKQWKNRRNRKPLIIQGARQVGKTWLMREFGQREYARTAYLSF
ncbi:MAG: AAA family ATPase, partial [Akkermansia sp.]|nr:AAA family ATPase [Akkermansia sp.]